MIDLHTHILPGLDDGARTMEDALGMARAAVGDGITDLVATPHGVDWGGGSRAELEARVEQLQTALAHGQVPVTIHPGLEVYLAPDLVEQLQSGRVFPLNGTRYVLVELPMQGYPLYAEQLLFDLQVHGYRPILAHPERNERIQERHDLLEQLVGRGVLAQVTAGSLLGAWGPGVRKAAQALLERRLVHVIASDAHHAAGSRAPILSQAVRAAAKLIGPEAATAMVAETPRRILADQDVQPGPPLAQSRKSWAFWR